MEREIRVRDRPRMLLLKKETSAEKGVRKTEKF